MAQIEQPKNIPSRAKLETMLRSGPDLVYPVEQLIKQSTDIITQVKRKDT